VNDDDRRLLIESIAEMRELKGEMREFKEHFKGRLEALEKKEGERKKDARSVLSLAVASAALAVNIIVSFFRHGGK
jgi:hypothetical protein